MRVQLAFLGFHFLLYILPYHPVSLMFLRSHLKTSFYSYLLEENWCLLPSLPFQEMKISKHWFLNYIFNEHFLAIQTKFHGQPSPPICGALSTVMFQRTRFIIFSWIYKEEEHVSLIILSNLGIKILALKGNLRQREMYFSCDIRV